MSKKFSMKYVLDPEGCIKTLLNIRIQRMFLVKGTKCTRALNRHRKAT